MAPKNYEKISKKLNLLFLLTLFYSITFAQNPTILIQGQIFGNYPHLKKIQKMKNSRVELNWHCRLKHISLTDSNGYFKIKCGTDTVFDFRTYAECGYLDTVISTKGIIKDTFFNIGEKIILTWCVDYELPNILFGFDSFIVDSQQITEFIVPLSKILLECDQIIIQLDGYSDCREDPYQNMKLSELRAIEVKNLLIKTGVNSDRIKIKGHGSKDFINNCNCDNKNGQTPECTENEYKKNRRVTWHIIEFSEH